MLKKENYMLLIFLLIPIISLGFIFLMNYKCTEKCEKLIKLNLLFTGIWLLNNLIFGVSNSFIDSSLLKFWSFSRFHKFMLTTILRTLPIKVPRILLSFTYIWFWLSLVTSICKIKHKHEIIETNVKRKDYISKLKEAPND